MKPQKKKMAVLSAAGILTGTAAQAAVNPLSSQSVALNMVEAVVSQPNGSAEEKIEYIKRLIEQEKLSHAASSSKEEGRIEMSRLQMTCGDYNL
ncbi:MAG: hypothetical protein HC902_00475 [Calothrix sp. SM1_5_4]|nr:hypothetical protein [Calothrix sp. SM1_5_4]